MRTIYFINALKSKINKLRWLKADEKNFFQK